jgi:glutathione S-transferase
LLRELDALLAGREWVLGSRYSVADPYRLVIYGWGKHNCMPVEELKNYTAFCCCSAWRFGQCLNARRAGCSRVDQIGP